MLNTRTRSSAALSLCGSQTLMTSRYSIKVFLPDIHHETEQQCHARLDTMVERLSKHYGAPDEETTDEGAGNEVTAWQAEAKRAELITWKARVRTIIVLGRVIALLRVAADVPHRRLR